MTYRYAHGMQRPNIDLARELRNNATPEERMLWGWLRTRPFGHKFRRQVPLGPYIVDFACLKRRLIIEADGQFHADQPEDLVRDAWLRSNGWTVLRYWNREIRRNFEGVRADVERVLET